MNLTKNKYLWLLLPALLLIYQIFVLAHYGFGSNDYGYLFGMGWRINNGQEIYIDFLYARPPLSPYLTAFWLYVLPEDGQFYYARIINYLYGFTSSLLLTLVLKRHFTEFFRTAHFGLILSLIIIFNVNYISHFWHTVDGLVMASIAIFIGLTKEKPSVVRIALMSLFVFLSMLTKQSFYPMPFAIAILFLIIYGKKESIMFILSILITILLFLSAVYVLANEQLIAYMEFKQHQSQMGPFLEAAVIYYINGWARVFLFLSIAVWAFTGRYLYKYIKRKQYAKAYKRFMLFFAKSYIILYIILLLQYTFVRVTEGVGIIIFHTPLLGGLVVAILWFVIELQQKRLSKKQIFSFMILTMTLALAWMSSLSWGYKTPALYSGSIIFFFIYLNWHYTKKQLHNIYLIGLLLSYVAAVTILQYHKIDTESVHLGEYSKKLNGIYERNDVELKKFLYANEKIKECNGTYAVLPAHPYAHWVYDDYPTLSLDWVTNVEMLNKKERLKEEISRVDCVILDPDYEFWENEKFGFDKNEMIIKMK